MYADLIEYLRARISTDYVQLFWYMPEPEAGEGDSVSMPLSRPNTKLVVVWGMLFKTDSLEEPQRSAFQREMAALIPYKVPVHDGEMRITEVLEGEAVAEAEKWNQFVEWIGKFHTARGDGFQSYPLYDFVTLAKVYFGHNFFIHGDSAAQVIKSIVANVNWRYMEEPVVYFEDSLDVRGWGLHYDNQLRTLWIGVPARLWNQHTPAAMTTFIQAIENGLNITVDLETFTL